MSPREQHAALASGAPKRNPGLSEQFAALVHGLSDEQYVVLGAIALEGTLARGTLGKLLEPAAAGRLDAFLVAATESGLLVRSREAPSIYFAAETSNEVWFRMSAEYEQLALRQLHAQRRLRDVARDLQRRLETRSVSDIVLSLQDGDLERFERAMKVNRLRRDLLGSEEWLRVAVCEPFDGEWFEGVFRASAAGVAARVLAAALETAERCDALLDWAKTHLSVVEEEQERVALANAVYQHALYRGTPASSVSGLPPELALGLEAALRFRDGDLAAAQRAVDGLVALRPAKSVKKPTPRCGVAAPIVALLLASRGTPGARAEARRFSQAWNSDLERPRGRAFRMLGKYIEFPGGVNERLDVYHLSSSTNVWEVLLIAYAASLSERLDTGPSRGGFADVVATKAAAWHSAGYGWIARQGLLLSRELSSEHAARALSKAGAEPATWGGGGELSLWDLFSSKPEWQRTLEALAEVSDDVRQHDAVAERVGWYVDMVNRTLSRPALQPYDARGGGFGKARRVSLAELHQRRETLPPEDGRVLDCTRETSAGKWDFTPEAFEALIDHPRVFDGARAGAQVAVVRGQCRIQTEDEAGYIRVVVEPAGAELGVNVVADGESRLLVYRVTPAMQRVIAVLPHGVRVPKAEESALVRVLGKLSHSVEVRSSVLGAERDVLADATPCVRIAPHSGAWLVQLGVRPFGSTGRFFVAGTGKVSLTQLDGGARIRTERDLPKERAGVAALIAECPALVRDGDEQAEAEAAGEAHSYTFGEESVLALLSELRDATTRHELEWPESPPLRLGGKVTSRAVSARLRVTKGWYVFTGGVRIGDVSEIALRELVRAPALARGRFVRLPTGDYVEVEERVRRVMAALATARSERRSGNELRLHPGAVGTLKELLQPENGVEVDDSAREWVARVEGLSTKEFPVPSTLHAELRSYQVEGFVWLSRLAELGLGACLADDMGLGKTVQIIALFLARAAEGAALVVAPTSVCGNWARELARFAPSLEVVEYAGKDRLRLLPGAEAKGAGKVVVTSYALLQQDEAALTAVSWATAVLDEAQFIKNPKSRRAEAACRLVAEVRVAATGTPVENHFGDLFSIFRFLSPGLLGEWAEFNRTFIEPVERGGLADPETALRNLVRPYVLRRLKGDVLSELPPLTEVQHEVHLSKDEAMRYALLRRQIYEKLFTAHGKRQNKIQALAELTRLRRFCCHPRLVFPDADTESTKVRTFLELVSELRDNERRALVFSQYVDFLGIVREALDELGVSYEYLDGSTPPPARQTRVDAFQRGTATLFLISLKAGGFGLNLTAADTVVHLDPWWNPAVEAQATDRAHRIGQERPVTVYRLVTRNTIEEKIVELHEKKQRLARTLLEGTEEPAQLSAEELLSLIEGDGSTSLQE